MIDILEMYWEYSKRSGIKAGCGENCTFAIATEGNAETTKDAEDYTSFVASHHQGCAQRSTSASSPTRMCAEECIIFVANKDAEEYRVATTIDAEGYSFPIATGEEAEKCSFFFTIKEDSENCSLAISTGEEPENYVVCSIR